MGNYVSRHPSCYKKEAEVCETPEPKSDARHHRVLKLDPRSPSAEIVRTPIQILDDSTPRSAYAKADRDTSILSTLAMRSSDVDLTSLCDTPTGKDQTVDSVEFEELIETIEAELAEIQETYKCTAVVKEVVIPPSVKATQKPAPRQKLQFTPEKEAVSKVPVNKPARTPLGLRSNNTVDAKDSPSTFIRMRQQRWVEENIVKRTQITRQHSFNCENTPPPLMAKAATLPRKRQVIEWDRESTIII